jgi:hypothetical protein
MSTLHEDLCTFISVWILLKIRTVSGKKFQRKSKHAFYHNNVTNLIHFHFHNHFIVSYPLHVSGVERPSSGGTILAVFGVSYVHL